MSRRGTRAAGRRVAPRVRTTTPPQASAGRRSGLLGGAAVLVVLAVLALAAFLPEAETGDTGATATRRTDVGRELVCGGGLPSARWSAGVVPGGAASPGQTGSFSANGRSMTGQGGGALQQPVVVRAGARAASRVWAVRSGSGSSWLAAGSCPAPAAEWWFPGAGAGTRHHGVLELSNPRDGDALVDVEVLGPKGPVGTPGLRGVRVASGRTVRLDLAKVAAAYGDLAVHVTATRGLVTATLPEQWAATVVGKSVPEWVTAQPAAARRSTLLGLGGKGDSATLLLANPSAREAVVSVQLLTAGGIVAPKNDASVTVPPGTVASVAFPSAAAAGALGVRVRSQVPISATVRTVHGADEAYAVAAEPCGQDAVVGVPSGGRGALVLTAGRATDVTVRSFDRRGRLLGTRQVSVAAAGTASVSVPAGAAALQLATSTGSSASALRAAVVLTSGSGIATVAVPATTPEAEVPPVVPLLP